AARPGRARRAQRARGPRRAAARLRERGLGPGRGLVGARGRHAVAARGVGRARLRRSGPDAGDRPSRVHARRARRRGARGGLALGERLSAGARPFPALLRERRDACRVGCRRPGGAGGAVRGVRIGARGPPRRAALPSPRRRARGRPVARRVRPAIELYPSTPWSLRLFDRIPLPAFWVGVGIGAAVFALFLLYTSLFGAAVGNLGAVAFEHGWLAEAIQDLFLGFTLAIAAASVRVTLRDFEALRPALKAKATDLEALRREILTYRRTPLAIAGLGFGLIAGVVTGITGDMWTGHEFPGWTHPAVVWLALRNFANWWCVGRAMLLELMLGHRFSRLGDHLASLELFDRSQLAPFGRRALRN